MSLASMVHFGDRLRGGIDVVGISNFVTFLESTSAYRRDLRRPGIRRRTAAAHARLSTEDFAADERGAYRRSRCWWCRDSTTRACRRRESQQMVAKIRARGGEVWYLAAKDEGPRVQEEAEPRLLPEDDRHVPGEAARRDEVVGPPCVSARGPNRREEEVLLRDRLERRLLLRVVLGDLLDVFLRERRPPCPP